MNNDKKLINKVLYLYRKLGKLKRTNINNNIMYFAVTYGITKNENFEIIPKFNYLEINAIFETSNVMFKNARTLGAVKFAYTYLCENYRDCGLIWQTLFKQQAKDACRRIRQSAVRREARKTLEFFGL